MTDFGDTIQVTLRVELYAFLRELAMTLKGKLANVFDSASGNASGLGGTGLAGSSGASLASGNKAGAGNKATPKKLVMHIQAFSLEPRVNVLENLTPYAVNKVFELLKIGDPQQMIPDAVHSGLTVNLEKLLFSVKDVFMRIDELYTPKKKIVATAAPSAAPSATPNVPRIFVSTPSQQRLPMSVTMKSSGAMELSPSRQASKSALGGRNLSSAMPRLTPSLSRMEAKPASKEEEQDSVFSLLDEDFN